MSHRAILNILMIAMLLTGAAVVVEDTSIESSDFSVKTDNYDAVVAPNTVAPRANSSIRRAYRHAVVRRNRRVARWAERWVLNTLRRWRSTIEGYGFVKPSFHDAAVDEIPDGFWMRHAMLMSGASVPPFARDSIGGSLWVGCIRCDNPRTVKRGYLGRWRDCRRCGLIFNQRSGETILDHGRDSIEVVWSECLTCGSDFKGDAEYCGIDPSGPVRNVCAWTGTTRDSAEVCNHELATRGNCDWRFEMENPVVKNGELTMYMVGCFTCKLCGQESGKARFNRRGQLVFDFPPKVIRDSAEVLDCGCTSDDWGCCSYCGFTICTEPKCCDARLLKPCCTDLAKMVRDSLVKVGQGDHSAIWEYTDSLNQTHRLWSVGYYFAWKSPMWISSDNGPISDTRKGLIESIDEIAQCVKETGHVPSWRGGYRCRDSMKVYEVKTAYIEYQTHRVLAGSKAEALRVFGEEGGFFVDGSTECGEEHRKPWVDGEASIKPCRFYGLGAITIGGITKESACGNGSISHYSIPFASEIPDASFESCATDITETWDHADLCYECGSFWNEHGVSFNANAVLPPTRIPARLMSRDSYSASGLVTQMTTAQDASGCLTGFMDESLESGGRCPHCEVLTPERFKIWGFSQSMSGVPVCIYCANVIADYMNDLNRDSASALTEEQMIDLVEEFKSDWNYQEGKTLRFGAMEITVSWVCESNYCVEKSIHARNDSLRNGCEERHGRVYQLDTNSRGEFAVTTYGDRPNCYYAIWNDNEDAQKWVNRIEMAALYIINSSSATSWYSNQAVLKQLYDLGTEHGVHRPYGHARAIKIHNGALPRITLEEAQQAAWRVLRQNENLAAVIDVAGIFTTADAEFDRAMIQSGVESSKLMLRAWADERATRAEVAAIRDSRTIETESGHTVDYDDGSITISFNPNEVEKYDEDYVEAGNPDGRCTYHVEISGDWYGGDDETPDEFSFSTIGLLKNGKWCCEYDDRCHESVSVTIADCNYYNGVQLEHGNGDDLNALPSDLRDALVEAVNCMIGDWEEITDSQMPSRSEAFAASIRDSIDTDEYIEMWNDHLLGSEGVQDLMNALIAEVERLRKQLSEAEDVIQYALDMTSDDDAKNVFEDFLGVEEEADLLIRDSTHWAFEEWIEKHVTNGDRPMPSDEQQMLINDYCSGLEAWVAGEVACGPRIAVSACAGSGKTTVLEILLECTMVIDATLSTRASAFNKHISLTLKEIILNLKKEGFTGAQVIGGTNSVQAAGARLIRDYFSKRGIEVSYDADAAAGSKRYRVISRIVLVEHLSIAPDGGRSILSALQQSEILEKKSDRPYFNRLVGDLEKMADVLMNQGYNPFDHGESAKVADTKASIAAMQSIVKPLIGPQGLGENTVLAIGAVGWLMVHEILWHGIERSASPVEQSPFSHRFDGQVKEMAEWVIPMPMIDAGRMDAGITNMRQAASICGSAYTDVAMSIGLYYPSRNQFAKKPTSRTTVARKTNHACALIPIEGLEGRHAKYNGKLIVELSKSASFAKIEGQPAHKWFWSNAKGHINGKRGHKYAFISPIMQAMKIKGDWLRIIDDDPDTVAVLKKKYAKLTGGFHRYGSVEESSITDAATTSGKVMLSMKDQTWLPLVFDMHLRDKWGVVMVDEVQDLSPIKAGLIWRCADMSKSAIVIVGDFKQAIYLFAGASSDAMAANQTVMDATVYPMTVSWRQSAKAALSCRNITNGAAKVAKGTWPSVDFPDYADHNAPSIDGWREGGEQISIDYSQIVEAVEHITASSEISLTPASKSFAVISRTNGPLGGIISMLVTAGIPVSTASGEGGIVSNIATLLKRPYRSELRAKNHRQGISYPHKGKKGQQGDFSLRDDLLAIRRLQGAVEDEWEQAIRRANGDIVLARQDENYNETKDTSDIAQTLMGMWFEANPDDERTVENFRSYCKNDLFSAEGEGVHVTSVHRYKGAENSVTFMLRGYPTQDMDGEDTVRDPFMLRHLVKQSPESAIEECNIVYVASSRCKDMNIIVDVLDLEEDDELPPAAHIIDAAFGIATYEGSIDSSQVDDVVAVPSTVDVVVSDEWPQGDSDEDFDFMRRLEDEGLLPATGSTKICALCDTPSVFTVEDLPTGTRAFCSEKCYAEYAGLPVKDEGYYGHIRDSAEDISGCFMPFNNQNRCGKCDSCDDYFSGIRDSAQYVSISLDEMDAFLVDAQGFTRVDPTTYEERHIGRFCRECVYDYPLVYKHAQNASIRVYSSIPLPIPPRAAIIKADGINIPATLGTSHDWETREIAARSEGRQQASRSKGKDAIRCLLVNEEGWPIKKFTRTHRVKNWRLNLLRKYEPAIEGVNFWGDKSLPTMNTVFGGIRDSDVFWKQPKTEVEIKEDEKEAAIPKTSEEFLALLSQFPEYDNMDELFHNQQYHPEGDGSLKAHMIAAFEKWKNISKSSGGFGCNTYFSGILEKESTVGFWALVFHDIGKQACAVWKPDDDTAFMDDDKNKGFHSFIKHESVGADIFVEKYSDLNSVVSRYADEIEWVIRQHTNFWQVGKHGKSLAIAKHPAFLTLAQVCLADKMGLTLPDGRDMDKEWSKRLKYFRQHFDYYVVRDSANEKYQVGDTTSCYCPNCPPESEPYKIYYMDKIEMRDAEGKWHTFPAWCGGLTLGVPAFVGENPVPTNEYLVSGGDITVADIGLCLSCDPSRPLDPYFIHHLPSPVAQDSTMPQWRQEALHADHDQKQMRKYQDMTGQCLCCGEAE